ncbi:MAG: hypothetical protein R3223_06420 [Longimicrobiales bacterium]|nr:hypothetical protein [Longimicrobiales bacterium]
MTGGRPGSLGAPRWAALLLGPLLVAAGAGALSAQSGSPSPASPTPGPEGPAESRAVATMSELMVQILYPFSDAVFYISTRTPTNEEEWLDLEAKTLMLAESANLLMMPGRSWGGEARREQWMEDALLLLEAGEAAFEAAKARDVDALAALNDPLYQSCVQCHMNFRPDYGRR